MRQAALSAPRWAQQEFGSVQGDLRNVRRLVKVAAKAARRPAGTITEVFSPGGEREGAYGLMANPRCTIESIAQGANQAAVKRCQGARVAIVPVDSTSLAITDTDRCKGTGPIGARARRGRGFKVMTAVVLVAGILLGVAAQSWWKRPERKRSKRRDQRAFKAKESYVWLQILQKVVPYFVQYAPGCRPWFQFDRDGDVHAVLWYAVQKKLLLTVRAQHDRVLCGSQHRHLRAHMRTRKLAGYTEVELAGHAGRKARTAKLAVRFDPNVTFTVRDRDAGRRYELTLAVVHAREVQTTPKGEKPIEWFLLTTYRVRTLSGALRVLKGYGCRFGIEPFFHAWKSGVCHAENTQLRFADRIQKWATILASVAARALHLTQLARQQPNKPSEEEFSQDEIDAVILLRKPRGWRVGQRPALGQLVVWIADLGGYSGKPSSPPPGKKVIARGLAQVETAVDVLCTLREQQGPPSSPKSKKVSRTLRRSGE